MKRQFPNLVSILAMGVLIACAADGEPPATPGADAGLSPAEQLAYEACLKDRQMVAMAWEAIKEECRRAATRPRGELPPMS